MSVTSKLANFTRISKSEGIAFAIRNVFHRLIYKLSDNYVIDRRRENLAAMIDRRLSSTIAYGPFKGSHLPRQNWWGIDRASMLLGLYEQEVLHSLTSVPSRYRTFVDVGAANGYYAVGVLVGELFDRSYCFEASEQGRSLIIQNATLNNVAQNIVVYGPADTTFFEKIPEPERNSAVILIDIEGAEFDLLSPSVLSSLRNSIVFVELHHWHFPNAEHLLAKLRRDVSEFFTVTEITTTARDLSGFPELRALSDTDRWLICSEGRAVLMYWYRLDPIEVERMEAAALI